LMRAEIARSIAVCIDANAYLDTALFAITSVKRRKAFFTSFTDKRIYGKSGYNFISLLQHYAKLILSINPSLTRLIVSSIIFIWCPLIISLSSLLILALIDGVPEIARGWTSLFALTLTTLLLLVMYALYTIKLIGVLTYRSSGFPQFLTIDRSLDQEHYRAICLLIDQI